MPIIFATFCNQILLRFILQKRAFCGFIGLAHLDSSSCYWRQTGIPLAGMIRLWAMVNLDRIRDMVISVISLLLCGELKNDAPSKENKDKLLHHWNTDVFQPHFGLGVQDAPSNKRPSPSLGIRFPSRRASGIPGCKQSRKRSRASTLADGNISLNGLQVKERKIGRKAGFSATKNVMG